MLGPRVCMRACVSVPKEFSVVSVKTGIVLFWSYLVRILHKLVRW